MYLSRCSFVFEFIAVVIIVPGTQWSLCITWNGRIYMHEWGAYDLILLSVWPIYVTNVRKGLSKSRKLDLQLVAQLRGDWTFRGFVHWWVCSEQSIWSWSPAEGIRTVGWGPSLWRVSLVSGSQSPPRSCRVGFFLPCSFSIMFLSCLRPRAIVSCLWLKSLKPRADVNPPSHRLLLSCVLSQRLKL